MATRQMCRMFLGVVTKTAEVDHPFEVGAFGCLDKDLGHLLFHLFECLRGGHRMDQVVGGLGALEGSFHLVGYGQVGFDDLHVVAPWTVVKGNGPAGHAPDPVPGVKQFRHESPTHVASRSGHDHRRSVFLIHHGMPHSSVMEAVNYRQVSRPGRVLPGSPRRRGQHPVPLLKDRRLRRRRRSAAP